LLLSGDRADLVEGLNLSICRFAVFDEYGFRHAADGVWLVQMDSCRIPSAAIDRLVS